MTLPRSEIFHILVLACWIPLSILLVLFPVSGRFTLSAKAISIKLGSPKSQIDTLNCTLEELAVLKAVRENPHITQAELKTTIGKSIATVKRLTVSLQEKGILVRKNGKRNGWWELNIKD